ncbi:alpha/beta fold hydrolase [Niveispirillum irakense]|uniref:alpha/beta fold hydrolase n=1 Tax=Niveispirillum irakense TaxID=34011 RepID=UPI001378DB33|nr:alpha/beta hydrolase [Niveispirillum irakense]
MKTNPMSRRGASLLLAGALLAASASLPLTSPALAQEAAPVEINLAELRQRYGAADDHYATIHGVEIRYRDEGKGPVLVLLHGSSSTLNSWDGVVARLKDHYRIIRYDHPPTGLSGPVSDAVAKSGTPPEAFVAGLLDKLGVEKAALFGTSSGGTLAYYFAATYPQRVTSLILANAPANSVAEAKIPTTAALDAEVARAQKIGYRDRRYWEVYLPYLYGDVKRLTPEIIDYYHKINLRPPEPNPRALYALSANKETTMARLKAVRAPVLILWGQRDVVLPPAAGTALFDYLENAESRSIIRMDSVGHFPALESPEQVADLVHAYLNRDH